MLVDRNELESQLFKNITAYGITTPKVSGEQTRPTVDFGFRLSRLGGFNHS